MPKSNSLSNIQSVLESLEKNQAAPPTTRKLTLKPRPLPAKPKLNPVIVQKGVKKPKISKVTPRRPGQFLVDEKPYFDLPVTYNSRVRKWITRFQSDGSRWFKKWLERSHRYMPLMTNTLKERGLPQDLAYVAMIESGFLPNAISSAQAVGYWQFIRPTANRYGLQTSWWLDERRDFFKSTSAAASYLGDLYKMFDSWYLSAAAYNMGEGRLRRLIEKHNSRNFWVLATKPDFPEETREYIPKLIAAMLISKAPSLYGIEDIKPMKPYAYDYMYVPGGTDLHNLATYLGINRERLLRLNPELVKGFVPSFVKNHRIRIPKGLGRTVSQFIRTQL